VKHADDNLLVIQARVLGALILRETRAAFGTSQFGYLWAIAAPAASVSLLVFLFAAIDRKAPYGESLALFFATGILILSFFRKLSGTLMGAFDANRALLTYPLVKPTDALLARLLLTSATYMMIMGLFFGGLVLFGLDRPPAHYGPVAWAFLSTAALGFGFGTLNAVIVSLLPNWTHVEKVLTRPLIFVSGVFYVPSRLPPEAREILQWNPVLHLIEWFREGFYPSYNSQILDPAYPLSVALLLILLGLAGERLFRQKRS